MYSAGFLLNSLHFSVFFYNSANSFVGNFYIFIIRNNVVIHSVAGACYFPCLLRIILLVVAIPCSLAPHSCTQPRISEEGLGAGHMAYIWPQDSSACSDWLSNRLVIQKSQRGEMIPWLRLLRDSHSFLRGVTHETSGKWYCLDHLAPTMGCLRMTLKRKAEWNKKTETTENNKSKQNLTFNKILCTLTLACLRALMLHLLNQLNPYF